MLSLLALKLLDKERRSHIDDFNFDEGLGLFAGLNVLPKKSLRHRLLLPHPADQQQKLLSGWVKALRRSCSRRPRPSPWTSIRSPIAATTGWRTTTCPCRGKAGPSVLTFFAQEQEKPVFCYANANLTRDEQAGEVMRFVEFWQGLTGHDPQWLYFDSKLTT